MIDISSSPPLASNTKKERRKTVSSLRVFLNIVVIFIFASGVVVPHPRVFHSWRRKRWVDDWLGGLKTHRRAHLVLALLKRGKSLTHLLVWLMDESIIGVALRDQSLEASDEKVLLLASMGGSTRGLWSCWRCTGRRRSRGCSWSTCGIRSGRRSCRSPNNVRLVSSMLSIIAKLHVSLVVDDLLNEWSIYRIHGPMVERKHQFWLEKYTDAWKRLIIKYG
jgi:hypothetical protein